MHLLHRVSNTLSYADCIPFVNLLSGCVHVIVHVANKVLGHDERLSNPPNETWKETTWKKLDSWDHLTKGALILSIVGTALLISKLFIRFIQYRTATDYIERFSQISERDLHSYRTAIPEVLRSSGDWVYTVCAQTDFPFEKASSQSLKNDKSFVLSLANLGKIRESDFASLPEDLREDEEVVQAVVAKGVGVIFYENMVNNIQDKELLKKNGEILILQAIKQDKLCVEDFADTELTATIALALVQKNPNVLFSKDNVWCFLDKKDFKSAFKEWCKTLYGSLLGNSLHFVNIKKSFLDSCLQWREKLSKRVGEQDGNKNDCVLLTEEQIRERCQTEEGFLSLFYK